jgi:hypothetical protein
MKDLLELQQRLTEDMPDDADVELCQPGVIDVPHIRFSRGTRVLYMIAPTPTSISYKRTPDDDWFNCSYTAFVSSMTTWTWRAA